MAQHGHEEPVGIARIDLDLGDLLPVAQPEMVPRVAAVVGPVDAVAHREVGPLHALAAAHVDASGFDGATATAPMEPVG